MLDFLPGCIGNMAKGEWRKSNDLDTESNVHNKKIHQMACLLKRFNHKGFAIIFGIRVCKNRE